MVVKPGKRLGKYRILARLGSGGFAQVFRALDTVEGVRVAIKVPRSEILSRHAQEEFRHEIRIAGRLDHPHILPIKNAEFYDGVLVVAYALGDETLDDRLRRRISVDLCLDLGEQMLRALAHAHRHRVIHCDVKPPNLILFGKNRLRLTDFGIAKVALRTMSASGSGTVGYVAPEQALGRPSFRSDVFSAGLVLFRMLSGTLPTWPYEWPLPGLDRLRRKVPPEFVEFLRRAMAVDQRRRFPDAARMLEAFRRLLPATRRFRARARRRRTKAPRPPGWRDLRRREFLRRYRAVLHLRSSCTRCSGPVAEEMRACPWCGADRTRHREESRFPARCPRCGRGRKRDWRFCAWCHGAGFEDAAAREYSDRRYTHRCDNPACSRKLLMPFMRYCPWCRRKVRRRWSLEGTKERCGRCGWGVARAYWDFCAWCGTELERGKAALT